LKVNASEQAAFDFLADHGLKAVHFTKTEQRRSKTPDFRVFKTENLVLYCEAKHVQHDDWLDRHLRTAKPLQIVGGLRQCPVFSRLCSHIHRAAQQFAAVNRERKYPNVLFFTNSDRCCAFEDLRAVLTGNYYATGGDVYSIYRQYSEGRIRDEKRDIDLYMWCDNWHATRLQPRGYFWEESQHYETLCTLLSSDPTSHYRIGLTNIQLRRYKPT
jgi:hypothetical protein